MAVQIPDPGTGNGQTGDNEYVFRKKVKDNFSDQTNAASKLVGKGAGQVPLSNDVVTAAMSFITLHQTAAPFTDLNLAGYGRYHIENTDRFTNVPAASLLGLEKYFLLDTYAGYNNRIYQRLVSYIGSYKVFERYGTNRESFSAWVEVYHTGNTSKDSNGFIKAASPIVKVFADKVELNGDAESQNVTYKKNGIGDYTITTVSGLSTDGWYIELPKDMNGNPKVAVTLSEVDGVISLKTYKRMFSMETFTFEPDLDNPLDIPDTRWIDLRLNEIPVEPSEPESEV